MKINGGTLFQLFKYVVYVLLTFNIYLFFVQEYSAAQLQFVDGVATSDLIEAYAATIDTFAWVILLLMFELETYVLEDRQFTRSVIWRHSKTFNSMKTKAISHSIASQKSTKSPFTPQ